MAVEKAMGLFDAELRLFHYKQLTSRKILFGGRDAVQDIEMEIQRVEIGKDKAVVFTRGSYGPKEIEQSLSNL